ncbi:MAG: flippase-like domain-containing protein [Chloroflexi bacterium]|nr:flippase-like domain-containing protein [Chloroflexota bacterium]
MAPAKLSHLKTIFRSNQLRWLGWLIPTAFVLLVGWFFARSLARLWPQIQHSIHQVNALQLVVASLLLVMGYLSLSAGTYLTVKLAGGSLAPGAVVKAFALSQPAKYLPGSIWSLPGRVYFYQRYGLNPVLGGASLSWELVTMVFSAVLVSVLGAGAVLAQSGALPLLILIGLAAAALAVIGLWPPLYRLARHWLGRLPRRFRPELPPEQTRFALYIFGLAVVGFCTAWVLIGLAFVLLVAAIYPQPVSPAALVGIYAGAWVVGFVVIVAPGGIGVREAMLVQLLGLLMPAPYPLLVATVSRLWWMSAEGISVLVGLAIRRPANPVTGEVLFPR